MIKSQMVGMTKYLYKNKFNSIYDGNLSMYERGKDFYYITQGSINKTKINESNIIKIPLSNDSFSQNKIIKASREIMFHDLIIKDRINANIYSNIAVIHCHSPETVAFMGLESFKRELSQIYSYFPELKAHLQVGKNVSRDHEPGSKSLATETANSMVGHNIVGHENHGIIAVSDDLQKCYDNIEMLEYYCRIYNLGKR